MRRDPWQALADPTRRKIIEVLATEPLSVNNIVAHFEISRPAVSKQLKILEACDLITIQKEGRENICTLSLEPLEDVSKWIQRYEYFWIDRLDRLDRYLKKKSKSSKKD